jgi:hypothetical protein
MAVLLHVLIALGSIAFTAVTFFRPSRTKLRGSYGLMALTIGSGTYLILSTRSHMIEACTMGLAYLGITLTMTAAAHYKLAANNER